MAKGQKTCIPQPTKVKSWWMILSTISLRQTVNGGKDSSILFPSSIWSGQLHISAI
jgi:hypothetical protein